MRTRIHIAVYAMDAVNTSFVVGLRVFRVVWIFVVVVLISIVVANHDFVDPVDVATHSSKDGWMSRTGARAPRPADDAFECPVGRVAA